MLYNIADIILKLQIILNVEEDISEGNETYMM